MKSVISALLHRDTPEREKPPETPPVRSHWAGASVLGQEAEEGKGHRSDSVGARELSSFWWGRRRTGPNVHAPGKWLRLCEPHLGRSEPADVSGGGRCRESSRNPGVGGSGAFNREETAARKRSSLSAVSHLCSRSSQFEPGRTLFDHFKWIYNNSLYLLGTCSVLVIILRLYVHCDAYFLQQSCERNTIVLIL